MSRARYHKLDEAVRNLKVGDIIFVHAKTLLGKLIRHSTDSHWSHVAIVFDVPDVSGTEHDVLIIEADWQVEIHRLTTYLHEPDLYEVGFKRMSFLTDEERERFRGFFLDAVDTPYDAYRLLLFFTQTVLAWAAHMDIGYAAARSVINTDNYICTSLTQRAYYLAVTPEKRGHTIFRRNEKGVDFLRQMEEITPAHIARSDNTEWLYNPLR